MVSKILLNENVIEVHRFQQRELNGLQEILVEFKVSSENYHDIAVLLYQQTFEVVVPEIGLQFKGTIQQYSTSITNLYEKDQIGDYSLTLRETHN
ncbi:DUF3219 family protein [Niallia sp. Krafla_26]|uniref:DUF3219 family protein n=1 Tax=Niallia sp. Krafla_26 TaxID=3064703 RepID=UPI003D187110